jgi:hypothetical protein
MDAGIERISDPEPIYYRPIRETRELLDSYGWEDVPEKDDFENEERDERAVLPYYMGVIIDLLA